MQRLIATFLMLSATPLCHALGADDVEFYGRLTNNRILQLHFVQDPKPWSKNNFVYGSSENSKLALCWSERINEVRNLFVCTVAKGSAPSLVYELLGSPGRKPSFRSQRPEGKEYRAISTKARLGDGTRRGNGILEAVYICKTGCDSSTPRHLYEVSKYD